MNDFLVCMCFMEATVRGSNSVLISGNTGEAAAVVEVPEAS